MGVEAIVVSINWEQEMILVINRNLSICTCTTYQVSGNTKDNEDSL